MVALNGGKPEVLTLIDMLKAFVAFREEVISRRTKFLLRKARDRAHVLVGLAIAVANIDEVIKLIRSAPDPQTAREQLMERRWPAADVEALILLIDDPRHRINEDGTYNLSEEQARAILELQPAAPDRARPRRDRRRTEQDRRRDHGLSSTSCRRAPASSRSSRTSLPPSATSSARRAAPRSPMAAPTWRTRTSSSARTWSSPSPTHGYIKRVPLSLYRAQRRGGKGRSGMSTKDEDFVTRLFVANTHTPILFFSSRGIVYKEKVWRLPIGNAAVARQVPAQHAAAARRASASPRSCRCRRTRRAGASST